jgi:hypothetical protein
LVEVIAAFGLLGRLGRGRRLAIDALGDLIERFGKVFGLLLYSLRILAG